MFLYCYFAIHLSLLYLLSTYLITSDRAYIRSIFLQSSAAMLARTIALAWQERRRRFFSKGQTEKVALLESEAFVRRLHCPRRENIQEAGQWEASPASLEARYRSLCGRPIKVWIIYTPTSRLRERTYIWEIFSENIRSCAIGPLTSALSS